MSMPLLGRQKLMLLKSMNNTEIILKLAPPTLHNNDTFGSELPIAGDGGCHVYQAKLQLTNYSNCFIKDATTIQMVRRHWISLF